MSVTKKFSVIFVMTCLALPSAAAHLCQDENGAEKQLQALNLLPRDNSITVPDKVKENIAHFLITAQHEGWCHDNYPAGNNIRPTGPMLNGVAHGTHARVKIYYSKGAMRWLNNGRKGDIPDGSMIVKEMYPYPAFSEQSLHKPDGWAVMVRDKKASHDGWLWYLLYVPGNTPYPLPFVFGQYGNSFCLSCHASTDNNQSTFAFLGNLEDRDVATYVIDGSLVQPPPGPPHVRPECKWPVCYDGIPDKNVIGPVNTLDAVLYIPSTMPRLTPNDDLLALFREKSGLPDIGAPDLSTVKAFPGRYEFDHVPAMPGEDNTFLTSFECSGCHDASDLISKINPNMVGQLDKPIDFPLLGPADKLNLSPYGEWTSSLMAVSGRDPVFWAQLEYELSSLNNAEEKADVSSRCLSCHSVMGERDNPELAGDPENVYAKLDPEEDTHSDTDIKKARFGALARDGISCTVCHRIADKGLGDTFSGEFNLGPSRSIYGPYEEVQTLPMENALGLTPTLGEHIKSAGLCGTCHALKVPVYDGDKVLKDRHFWEQTTYMEWANSDYADTGSLESRTCQECHMPETNPLTGAAMSTRIANIEDETFPYAPGRAKSGQLHLPVRGGEGADESYRRHVMVGANVFVMSMFEQFPRQLGANTHIPGRSATVVRSKLFATEEALRQARQRTATVSVRTANKTNKNLEVSVEVTNFTGHKLPSGVGFRRAFIELAVLDKEGAVLWCSGCTDNVGVITDTAGNRLASEFAALHSDIQPDHSIISSDKQVQIYEERIVDEDGQLTTSFLHLYKSVKDNRLLPRGWKPEGPWADLTAEHGMASTSLPGKDDLTYSIPLVDIAGAESVRVAMQYQSIPPYYLAERFSLLSNKTKSYPETERLLAMVLNLNLDQRADNWKLGLACRERPIALGSADKNCLPPVRFVIPVAAQTHQPVQR